jgi:hypothetical protein
MKGNRSPWLKPTGRYAYFFKKIHAAKAAAVATALIGPHDNSNPFPVVWVLQKMILKIKHTSSSESSLLLSITLYLFLRSDLLRLFRIHSVPSTIPVYLIRMGKTNNWRRCRCIGCRTLHTYSCRQAAAHRSD